MSHLDGNAAAGPLSEVFARDITTADVTCASCGASGPVAAAMLYRTVLRCATCDAVLMRYARVGGELSVELRGTRVIRWPA
jgi:hypothetical protein